jgi:adhesin transport system membrane fusion protein
MSDAGGQTRSATGMIADLNARMGGARLTIWLCALAVWAFVLWASLAWVDEIVRAPGVFISNSRPQIIQNLEGGILAELRVREGDVVERGQVLARLHDTRFMTEVEDLRAQIAGLEVRQLRLEAELAGQYDVTVRSEGAKRVLEQAAEEKRLLERLLDQKIVALIEVTRARKSHADAAKRYEEIVTQAELERAEAYAETLKELATLRQTLRASQDQLDRTVLLSPMRGVVNTVKVTTIGGVVRPGEEILEIIPLDEALHVEARVAPRDIANIRRGQEATIKLTAYDYTIWGTLKGRVDFISADTFKDERARDPDGDPHYKVTLRVDMDALTPRQAGIEIRPGMQAEAELHTGEKTVLQYLLKPLYKSQQALREP